METRLESVPEKLTPDPLSLAAVLESGELGRQLRPLVYECWGARRADDLRARLLRIHAGNRSTLEISIRTERGSYRLIGKAYSRDRGDVFEAMKKIWQAGMNEEAERSIARPIAYLPSLRLLLQEKVEGTVANDLFVKGNASQRAETAEQCARWLAHFQALAPRQGRIMDTPRILRHSERRLRFIVETGVAFASKARKLFEHLATVPPALESDMMRAGHGDFKPEHLFLQPQRRTVAFDWDCYDIADPCRDAALFLIYLERLALSALGRVPGVGSTSRIFLETYMAASRLVDAARLRFHKVALYLQEAKRDLGEQHPGWLARAEIMLDQGLQELER